MLQCQSELIIFNSSMSWFIGDFDYQICQLSGALLARSYLFIRIISPTTLAKLCQIRNFRQIRQVFGAFLARSYIHLYNFANNLSETLQSRHLRQIGRFRQICQGFGTLVARLYLFTRIISPTTLAKFRQNCHLCQIRLSFWGPSSHVMSANSYYFANNLGEISSELSLLPKFQQRQISSNPSKSSNKFTKSAIIVTSCISGRISPWSNWSCFWGICSWNIHKAAELNFELNLTMPVSEIPAVWTKKGQF